VNYWENVLKNECEQQGVGDSKSGNGGRWGNRAMVWQTLMIPLLLESGKNNLMTHLHPQICLSLSILQFVILSYYLLYTLCFYVSIATFGFRFWITVFDVKTAVKAVKAMKSKQ
jgi:hypothetical protein